MKPFSELKILLAEDNPADARLMVSLISAVLHTSCDVAVTFQETLESLAKATYDLLILDIILPDIETLAGLTQINTLYPSLPVIIVTGLEEATAIEAVERGAQDFVRKDTLSPDIISRSVLYALRRQEVQNELNRLKSQRKQEIERVFVSMRDMQRHLSLTSTKGKSVVVPLRERDPSSYAELLRAYRQSFQAFLKRIREGSSLYGIGKTLGNRLAVCDATPNDATEMHLTVLDELAATADGEEWNTIALDGRMFALEVMGYLANRYRDQMRRER